MKSDYSAYNIYSDRLSKKGRRYDIILGALAVIAVLAYFLYVIFHSESISYDTEMDNKGSGDVTGVYDENWPNGLDIDDTKGDENGDLEWEDSDEEDYYFYWMGDEDSDESSQEYIEYEDSSENDDDWWNWDESSESDVDSSEEEGDYDWIDFLPTFSSGEEDNELPGMEYYSTSRPQDSTTDWWANWLIQASGEDDKFEEAEMSSEQTENEENSDNFDDIDFWFDQWNKENEATEPTPKTGVENKDSSESQDTSISTDLHPELKPMDKGWY